MQWRTTRLSGHGVSCAAFCSMCYRKACTRFVTTASGIRLGASTLNEPVSCSCSIVQQHRLQPHDPPRRLTVPLIGRLIMYHPTKPVFARAVSRAVSFAPPAFTPNRQTDHDPYCFAATIITAVVPACSGHATAALCLPFASLCLVVLESPASASDYPHLIA
jgi:hypothetical protein